MFFDEVGKFVKDGLNNAGKIIVDGANAVGETFANGADNAGKFISENKDKIVQGVIVVGTIVGAAALAAVSGADISEELTEGQKLDLSNALDSVRCCFDEEIESAYASGDSIVFDLSNGETECIGFRCDSGYWSAYSSDSEVVSNAVELILDELN